MGISSIVGGVVSALTGGTKDAAGGITGQQALAKFKDLQGADAQKWAESNGAEFQSYVAALGTLKSSEISQGLTKGAIEVIAANLDNLQLDKDASKNLLNGIIRKRIFAEMTEDAFSAMGKIKHDWHI